MRPSKFSVFFLLVFATTLAVHESVSSSSSIDFDGGLPLDFLPAKSECRGSIAECTSEDDEDYDLEFAVDSEVNRRILATTKYISYDALRRNSVPCSRRGASYYNCRAGAQANLYSRGCSTITRCRR